MRKLCMRVASCPHTRSALQLPSPRLGLAKLTQFIWELRAHPPMSLFYSISKVEVAPRS